MKTNTILITLAAAALAAAPATAQSLGVTANVSLSAGLYSYDYTFSVTGSATTPVQVDNLFLSSDDLAPVTGPTFKLNGVTTTNWYDADYATGTSSGLQFSTDDLTSGLPTSPLGNGDTLEVLFASPLAPKTTHAAIGLDYVSGGATNTVTGLVGPTAAVPEAGSLGLLALGALPLALLAARRRK